MYREYEVSTLQIDSILGRDTHRERFEGHTLKSPLLFGSQMDHIWAAFKISKPVYTLGKMSVDASIPYVHACTKLHLKFQLISCCSQECAFRFLYSFQYGTFVTQSLKLYHSYRKDKFQWMTHTIITFYVKLCSVRLFFKLQWL